MGAEKRQNGCVEEKLYFGATVHKKLPPPPITPHSSPSRAFLEFSSNFNYEEDATKGVETGFRKCGGGWGGSGNCQGLIMGVQFELQRN